MTELFLFNEQTGEYFASLPYDGGEIPENGTLKTPPETEDCEVNVFENNNWVTYADYRFKYMKKDASGNITPIETIGEIETGYTLVDFEEAQTTLHNNNLHITKLDFFNALCVPAGITYNTLMAKIDELNMRASWEFCNHVYFGVIKPFLQALPFGKTEAEVIAIFEQLQNDSETLQDDEDDDE